MARAMSAAQKAALRKAQLASARKRRRGVLSRAGSVAGRTARATTRTAGRTAWGTTKRVGRVAKSSKTRKVAAVALVGYGAKRATQAAWRNNQYHHAQRKAAEEAAFREVKIKQTEKRRRRLSKKLNKRRFERDLKRIGMTKRQFRKATKTTLLNRLLGTR